MGTTRRQLKRHRIRCRNSGAYVAANAASRLASTTPFVWVCDQCNNSIMTMCHVALVNTAIWSSSGSLSMRGSNANRLAFRASNRSKQSLPVIVVHPDSSRALLRRKSRTIRALYDSNVETSKVAFGERQSWMIVTYLVDDREL